MNLGRPDHGGLPGGEPDQLVGNWVLISGRLGMPAMGVSGSAWATVASRVGMLAFAAIYAIWHGTRHETGLLQVSLAPDLGRMARLVRLGLPSAVQLTLELVVFVPAALLAGRLGDEALAAHEVVLLVAGTAFMVPLGVSAAGAVRVGQAIGRGDPVGAVTSGWTAMGLGAGFMAISGLTMLIVPGPILGMFTGDPGVIRTAHSLLLAAAVFQIFDGLQVVGSGVLRGPGRPSCHDGDPHRHWAIGLPIGYAMAFPGRRGVVGLWVGLASGLIVAGLLVLVAWIRRVRSLDSRPDAAPR